MRDGTIRKVAGWAVLEPHPFDLRCGAPGRSSCANGTARPAGGEAHLHATRTAGTMDHAVATGERSLGFGNWWPAGHPAPSGGGIIHPSPGTKPVRGQPRGEVDPRRHNRQIEFRARPGPALPARQEDFRVAVARHTQSTPTPGASYSDPSSGPSAVIFAAALHPQGSARPQDGFPPAGRRAHNRSPGLRLR